MRTALVTGATGLLGSHVVERLVSGGWSIRALVRDPVRARWLEAPGVTLVPGDLGDAPGLCRAAGGCDAVVHAAAWIGPGSDWAPFRHGNVVGTENVIAAAAAAGARLVHVSTTSVYGQARYRDVPTDEDSPLPELPAGDAYGRSKQEAERLVLASHAGGRVWTTVVRPPVMYGRRDRQFVPRLAPVLERGVFPLIGGGRTTLPLVHASAVADGAVRAAEADVAGGRVYLLTDDFVVTVADLLRLAAEGLGRRLFTPRVPLAGGWAGFRALEAGLAAVGRRDLAARATGTFRMLSRDNPFTSRRARDELGWAPRLPPSEGIPDAFRWWKARRSGRSRAEG